MRLSILICTRNGAPTIADAISCLGRQISVSHDNYEVIVVDNGSTDNTNALAGNALKALPCHSVMLKERREGKVNAFLSGVAASKAPLISIVDDDNLVGEEFIFRTLDMFDSFPELGIVGSVNTLLAESPPAWFPLAAASFGCSRPWFEGEIRKVDEFRVIASFGGVAGAGSTFRKRPLLVALERGFAFMNDTLRGSKLSVAGEDLELCWLLKIMGYWFGCDARITLRHKINPSRLSWQYARRLARSTGAGALVFDAFSLLSTESKQSRLKDLRATWQWMAARRLRRIVNLLPAASAALIGRREIDPIWIRWNTEVGAFTRILRERGLFTNRMRAMRTSDWTHLRRESISQAD